MADAQDQSAARVPRRICAALAPVVAAVAAAVLAGCGGGSDGDESSNERDETAATQAETAPGGVLPEIATATEEAIAHLEAEGAVPDDQARARVSDRFDASQRLRFPPGGPDCRVRAIAAGSSRLVDFTQRAPIYDEVVTDPDETVAVALDLPNVDSASPASVRCIDAMTDALAVYAGGSAAPISSAPSEPSPSTNIEILDSGVTTTSSGFYVGAVIGNTGGDDLSGVEIGFDVLNAAGEVIGAGQPVQLSPLPQGRVAGVGSNATNTECGCDAAAIDAVQVRVEADDILDEVQEPESVPDAAIENGSTGLELSGTIDNPGSSSLIDPRIGYAVLDARGRVLSGNTALLVGVEVPGEGSVPFETMPPRSFIASLPRPPAVVRASVID